MTLDEQLGLFFKNPFVYQEPPGTFSVLHLLRRDIRVCLGTLPGATGQALWPGAMAILAGVDLLAKFWRGDDGHKPGEVGDRFRDFIAEYFPKTDASALYQLRNALLHSFGLYSASEGIEYRFVLTADGRRPLVRSRRIGRKSTFCVDILSLAEDFEKAIEAYRAALSSRQSLQSKFSKMLPKYGTIQIGSHKGCAS